MRLSHDRALLARARELRNHSTLAEVLLWKYLKGRQRCGYDFHRQRPISRFIVDFFAPKLKLVVEVDGATHDFRAETDAVRDRELRALGLEVLRFGDREVKRDALGVAEAIDRWIAEHAISESKSDVGGTHPGAARHPSC